MSKVLILLYKDFLIRRRNVKVTLCEFFAPVLLACVPLLLSQYFNTEPEMLVLEHTFPEYYFSEAAWPNVKSNLSDLEDPFEMPDRLREGDILSFFYTPQNFITKDIIWRAVYLWMNKTDITSSDKIGEFLWLLIFLLRRKNIHL